ncbi:MAG: hypothetical protein AMXMBFR22_08950 [Phycisphaerae bacterium]
MTVETQMSILLPTATDVKFAENLRTPPGALSRSTVDMIRSLKRSFTGNTFPHCSGRPARAHLPASEPPMLTNCQPRWISGGAFRKGLAGF